MNETIVEVKNLTVRFEEFTAVNDISFSVRRGEIFGFLGANGAGKTTTIRVLCGLLTPSEGEAFVCQTPVTHENEFIVKSKVGYMSQKFTLYNDLTVKENLDFTANLRKLPSQVSKSRQKELLDFISFQKPLNTLVRDLPGGMKQQVSLAASLLHDPEIVFLDEPTAGVSPGARALFWNLIRDLSRKGKTIFVTSHYMDEVEQCDTIALMRSGEIIALGSPEELKTDAFPGELFEMSPKIHVSKTHVQRWKKNPLFASFSPYGLHYHVTISDPRAWQRFQIENEELLSIHKIKPSLEDVFIQLVQSHR